MFDAARTHLQQKVQREIDANCRDAVRNLTWLNDAMPLYFAITMQDEPDAVAALAIRLNSLATEERLILADNERRLILARRNMPGSLYDTMKNLKEREISYAQFIQSHEPLPGLTEGLELQRFEFDRRCNHEISDASPVRIPDRIKGDVTAAMRETYPAFDLRDLNRILALLWLNNENYVRISPAKRIAQVLWMYQQSSRQGGIYFDVEPTEEYLGQGEYRVMFAVGNPPQADFLVQIMEVFNRLEIGVRRAFCLTISNGIHPYFLGTFYVRSRDAALVEKGANLYERLKVELYNTQILSSSTQAYREFVADGVTTGEEASLVNAFISFCHTNLAHNQPDRFGFEDVTRAFLSHPDTTLQLIRLFMLRFDPRKEECQACYEEALAEAEQALADYNTGHRHLDEIRRTVFRCALCLITHTLKTNFFVAEKHALAFRLDPSYLEKLGTEFIADLPAERPFRITFFFGRHGAGYHIGFSDIARGGWRTILTKGWDDYVTTAATLFRENYVLAHTQHLKNKDIYEGGSKMVVVLDAADLADHDLVTRRLYKLQYGFINAFFDIFVTRDGRARDPRVIDYYGEDEPIELGPDENMHDTMVELVARESVRRGYLLGIGVISSKKAGINHKEYGVTSTGVVKFAEIAMAELGIDIRHGPFSVLFTGGPNGDVAGNAMRLMLERCPRAEIRLIMDGSAALCDPLGADHAALQRIVLSQDLECFDSQALHEGGYLLYRNQRRTEGLRELHRKVTRTPDGMVEEWITLDEFNREWSELIFNVEADLFIPAGGRPETVAENNWHCFLRPDGSPKVRAVVEGANSFFTPAARLELQRRGILILRDASANKCGVISSSFEIIANLLMSEKEFLEIKERYVADVLDILEQRAEEEARLIFRRRTESGNTLLCTDISAAISQEINAHYARLFGYFQNHPAVCEEALFVRAIEDHLPRLLRENRRYRQRLRQLPAKYRYAILAGQIASSLVYRGNREAEFVAMLKVHLEQSLAA
ncbi:NAD-glutamate dehydrogenase domain-containing protein [Geobacter argillaceus]|uniref:Glutamate dehydrogenase (NAD) n=1 Tax=Geobacter argillaceus TaxID=345631 RepID=A0A562VN67_9BACT|nr:NAD-glutamate dehydrogenase domain-containing protein [Geobacter argillaceus]TWJ19349.1 glutamate dehydrogenase (NAD) [Geobacter argillaceus]